jgi:phage anti-repressor protein
VINVDYLESGLEKMLPLTMAMILINNENNMTNSGQTTDTNLIPVFTAEIGGVIKQTVDARDLHGFLGVKRDFTSWIKKRIEEYGFMENEDYLLTKMGEQHLGGTKYLSEFTLVFDMAKELSMVEKNTQGKAVRKYFIECERKLHDTHQSPIDPVRKQPIHRSYADRRRARSTWISRRETRFFYVDFSSY